MSTVDERCWIPMRQEGPLIDEAQVAVAAFLARYRGRTLEAYRYDLRNFFQWAADHDLAVLEATRPHIELFRCSLEERSFAASTIDRHLSTVCGFYRFAHIDGRIASNPAQYVRRVRLHPPQGRGLDRTELGTFLFAAERQGPAHHALASLLGLNGLRVSEACGTNIEDLGMERGHRTLKIMGKGSKPATIPLVPRVARAVDLAVGEIFEARSCAGTTELDSTGEPPTAGCVPSAGEQASTRSIPTCSERPSSWPPSTPASRCATCSWPPAMPTPALQRSTTAAVRTSTATLRMSSSHSSPEAEVAVPCPALCRRCSVVGKTHAIPVGSEKAPENNDNGEQSCAS